MLYDYSITSFMILAGLVTSEILTYFVLGAAGVFLLWIFFALVFSLEYKFHNHSLKMIKYLKKTDKNSINMEFLDKHIKKTSKGFYAGWKRFKSSSYGKPSDYIRKDDVLDPEVNGGSHSHGKSFMNAFINFIVILTALFCFVLNGGSETITFSLFAEVMVMPLCTLFVLKILYYLYISLKRQLYTSGIEIFYELIDLMDEKLDKGEQVFIASTASGESKDFADGEIQKYDEAGLSQDENEFSEKQSNEDISDSENENAEDGTQSESQEENLLDKYDIFKKKNIDVSKLINEVPESSSGIPFINVDSNYVIKDDQGVQNQTADSESSFDFGEFDNKNSSDFIDIEKPIAEIDQEKIEKLDDEQDDSRDENFEQDQAKKEINEFSEEKSDKDAENSFVNYDNADGEQDLNFENNSEENNSEDDSGSGNNSLASLDEFGLEENSDNGESEAESKSGKVQNDEISDATDMQNDNLENLETAGDESDFENLEEKEDFDNEENADEDAEAKLESQENSDSEEIDLSETQDDSLDKEIQYVDNLNDIDFSDFQNLYGKDETQNEQIENFENIDSEQNFEENNLESQNEEGVEEQSQSDSYADDKSYEDNETQQNDEIFEELNNGRDEINLSGNESFSENETYSDDQDVEVESENEENETQNSNYDISNIVGGMRKNKSKLASGGVDIVRNKKRTNKTSNQNGIQKFDLNSQDEINSNSYERRPYEYTNFENEPYLEEKKDPESKEQNKEESDGSESQKAKSSTRTASSRTKKTTSTKVTTRSRTSSKTSKTTRAKTSRAKTSSTKTRSGDMAKRGRPKKQVIDESFAIKNDREFESVLARAEKLMRKSESGLSESQQKRIEKELKALMDAMNKYKETK